MPDTNVHYTGIDQWVAQLPRKQWLLAGNESIRKKVDTYTLFSIEWNIYVHIMWCNSKFRKKILIINIIL